MAPRVQIAIDAMGGDFAPKEIVQGAVAGARAYDVQVLLVGPEAVIQQELAGLETHGLDIKIVHASEVIDMGESPATALRKKKDASIIVTAQQVRKGAAQAMIAAGSTGAAMAAALLHVGRLEGIDRPAIGVTLPSVGTPCLLLDAGANADCIPEMLLQFARMGKVFMQQVYHLQSPRVGVLNIGSEEGKGNSLVNAAYHLMEADPNLNFIGNVEGNDMFKGHVDVAVCDGFTGNVALKSIEGVGRFIKNLLREELNRRLTSRAVGLLAKPAIRRALKRLDPEEFGGALLLGIKGICVIGHGGSTAFAIKNAIRVAKEAVQSDVLGKISQLSDPGKPVAS